MVVGDGRRMLELISQMADATSHLMEITGVRLVGCSGRRSVTAGTASNQNHFLGLRFSWTVTVILTTCLDTRVEGSNDVPRPWMIHRQSVQPTPTGRASVDHGQDSGEIALLVPLK